MKDTISISVDRTYRSQDTQSRTFGVGTSLSYDMFIITDYQSYADLVLPDGSKIHYICGATSCLPLGAANPTYAGSVLNNGYYYTIRLKDGTVLDFAPYASQNSHSAGVRSITDRYGNIVTITRDDKGNTSTVTSPNGRHLFFTYDSANRVKQVADDAGRTVTYQYNPDGTLQSVTDPLLNKESYTYDPTTLNMLTVTDKRGNTMVTNAYYSGTGNAVLDGRVKLQTYADQSTTTFAYGFSTAGSLAYTDLTDERKAVRRTVFDDVGYVVSIIHAMGKSEQHGLTLTRDPFSHLVTRETDSLGRVTDLAYDENGNVTKRTVMSGTSLETSWTYTWDTTYNVLTSATDPLGHTNNLSYDANGNLIERSDALGHKVVYSYNPDGQIQSHTRYPVTQSPASALTTTFSYLNGDLQTITDPLSRTTTFNYDVLGRATASGDAAGQLWTTGYDPLDRVTQRCDPGGVCSTLQYDANGNLRQFIKGSSQRDYTYDKRNRLLTEGRGSKIERTYAYASDYLHTTLTEASGRVTTTTLDALGRSKTMLIDGTAASAGQRTLSYVWDSESRLKSLNDSVAGTLSYTYDNRFDTVTSETGPAGTVSYTYNAAGWRDSATPSGGTQIDYHYDAAGRLNTLTQAAGSGASQPAANQVVGLSYDDADRRQTLSLPNGIVLTYGFDNASQLQTLTWRRGGTVIGDLSYGYNLLGQRTSLSGFFAHLQPSTALTLGVDSDGRLSSENGTALAYDANGRLIQDAQYRYVWNEAGLLGEIHNLSDNALRASYTYDPLGRRLARTVDGQTLRYLHDGINPIQIQNGSGTPLENLLAGGIDEWFARTTAGQTQIYLSDALGSTLRLTNTSGNKLVDYRYDAYGATSNDASSVTNRFQYTGRENDGLGLYFYRARYYKPGWGRFISQDPIGLAGGENLYAYVNGNPISKTDPEGLLGSGSRGSARASYPRGQGPGSFPPDRWTKPITPTGSCATAECAAGLLPQKPDLRTPEQVDKGQCELVCGLTNPVGPIIPTTWCGAIGYATNLATCKLLCQYLN